MGWDGPLTHKQYEAWQAWLEDEWNIPERSDYYAMQIAAEIRRKGTEHPERIRTNDFVIKFPERKKVQVASSRAVQGREPTKEEKQRAAAKSKAAWIGAFGGNVKIVTLPSGSK